MLEYIFWKTSYIVKETLILQENLKRNPFPILMIFKKLGNHFFEPTTYSRSEVEVS